MAAEVLSADLVVTCAFGCVVVILLCGSGGGGTRRVRGQYVPGPLTSVLPVSLAGGVTALPCTATVVKRTPLFLGGMVLLTSSGAGRECDGGCGGTSACRCNQSAGNSPGGVPRGSVSLAFPSVVVIVVVGGVVKVLPGVTAEGNLWVQSWFVLVLLASGPLTGTESIRNFILLSISVGHALHTQQCTECSSILNTVVN